MNMMFKRMNQARKKERKDSRTKTVRAQEAREPGTGKAARAGGGGGGGGRD